MVQFERLIATEQREHILPAIVAVDHLSYQYANSNQWALKDVSFEIHQGETVGVVGDSGSGKTTLLHAVAGFIPHFYRDGAYKGDVEIIGKKTGESSLYDLMEQIGVVFQDPSTQSFGMHVDTAVAFGMENLRFRQAEMNDQLQSVASALHIEHLLRRNTRELSGGELQATAIASVLAMNPNILLFDEVISALDSSGQQRIKELIRDLKTNGRTMVIVDSDVRWLAGIVDRLLILDKGEMVYDGNPLRIYGDKELAKASGLDGDETHIQFREPASGTPLVRVEHVSYSYDARHPEVLSDITLNVKKGSCTAFVGHNGSGKTTLAKLIAGLINLQDGDIHIDGKQPARLSAPELVKEVGYVFQNPSQMFVASSVEEELLFTPSLLNRRPAISLEEIGLAHVACLSPWELSAGQQQRLAVASVLASEPEVIILDEPTLGQTRQDRERLVGMIGSLQQKGKTIILISHDLQFIADAAEDVHVLNKGQIVRSGEARKVLQDKKLFEDIGLPLPW